MKIKLILLLLFLAVLASLLIPVNQQKTILIKSSFLNLYSLLSNPEKWERWRPDIQKDILADSGKISIKKDTGSFTIKYAPLELLVKLKGNSFDIEEKNNGKSTHYSYIVAPLPNKLPAQTILAVDKKTKLLNYLIGQVSEASFADTHIDDLKKFMENDDLLYGFKITKIRVPESNLIVVRKEVLKNKKFAEAAQMLTQLQQFVKMHGVKQMQPLIAQFLPRGEDSSQVNVGFFIDKEVVSDKAVTFVRMPKGGPLYSAVFNGKFNKRQKVYNALQQYFIDHTYQSAILPFESYLDNKLPTSDTDDVNIRVNFSTYF